MQTVYVLYVWYVIIIIFIYYLLLSLLLTKHWWHLATSREQFPQLSSVQRLASKSVRRGMKEQSVQLLAECQQPQWGADRSCSDRNRGKGAVEAKIARFYFSLFLFLSHFFSCWLRATDTSWLMLAYKRTLKQYLVSYRVVFVSYVSLSMPSVSNVDRYIKLISVVTYIAPPRGPRTFALATAITVFANRWEQLGIQNVSMPLVGYPPNPSCTHKTRDELYNSSMHKGRSHCSLKAMTSFTKHWRFHWEQ